MATIDKILDLDATLQKVKSWKGKSMKVVFSNGCFDILHAGHVDYLEKARQCGDRLVVALNSDKSVKRIKGENRPVISQIFRSRMLAALAFVDIVVMFDDDTPIKLIKQLKPDILIKGKDYNLSNIIGADFVLQHGGKVETIELTEGLSTTAIIEKIKKL